MEATPGIEPGYADLQSCYCPCRLRRRKALMMSRIYSRLTAYPSLAVVPPFVPRSPQFCAFCVDLDDVLPALLDGPVKVFDPKESIAAFGDGDGAMTKPPAHDFH